jgi:hypothetical protein
MCLSCGCKIPDENHGDDRNIIREQALRAADAANVDIQTVARNIFETLTLVDHPEDCRCSVCLTDDVEP